MRGLSAGAVAIAVTVALGACGSRPTAEPQSVKVVRHHPAAGAPNVVVVMTDDQRVDDVRAMPAVRHLLAAKGVTFSHNFATYPLCCPSRTTFMTGEYAHNHRVRTNDAPGGGYVGFTRKVRPQRTIGVQMQRGGYRTGYVGKFLNGFRPNPPSAVPPGWDVFDGLLGDTEYAMYGYGVDENGATVDYGSSPRDYQTDVLARYATDFVRRSAAGRRPFFLTLTPVAPHDDSSIPKGRLNPVPGPGDRARVGGLPLPHPPGFGAAIKDEPSELHRKPLSADELRSLTLFYRGRIGSLLAVDRAVRDLVGTLRSTGELANTVIIFTSDNGFLLGEHRHKGKEQPYEPSVRVPLIIRGPGFPSGVTRDELVANIDLAPTIRQLAGLDWRSHTDGIPLRPVARASGTYAGRPIIFERSQSEGKPYTALRTGRYAYVLWHSHHTVGPQELFDLKRDPYELRNVAPDPAYVRPLGVLRRELQSRRDCSGEKCRIPAPPIPAPSG